MSIDVKDLRIGNYINTEHGIGKVASIYRWAPDQFKVGVNVPPLQKYEYQNPIISGILLTPHLLVRCGFELDASCQFPQWMHKSGFWFFDKYAIDKYSIRLMDAIDVEFIHLHFLQNFFYTLTQTELIIDLS